MTIRTARPIVALTMALGIISAACVSGGEVATPPATLSTVVATTMAEADVLATEATTSTEAPSAETTTTTLSPGAAGSVDFDYLFLSPGSRFVSLDDPVMVPASEVGWLQPDSIILGIVHPSGEAHAFPADMMAYHHVANTTIAGEPYLVTY